MSSVLIPKKTEQGWIIEMPPEMAQAIGVAEGSFVVLYAKDGQLVPEILPPLAPDLKAMVREICEENREFFEELKRLGD
jgi:antitoxin component of MazEF toxin-antitoxin module